MVGRGVQQPTRVSPIYPHETPSHTTDNQSRRATQTSGSTWANTLHRYASERCPMDRPVELCPWPKGGGPSGSSLDVTLPITHRPRTDPHIPGRFSSLAGFRPTMSLRCLPRRQRPSLPVGRLSSPTTTTTGQTDDTQATETATTNTAGRNNTNNITSDNNTITNTSMAGPPTGTTTAISRSRASHREPRRGTPTSTGSRG